MKTFVFTILVMIAASCSLAGLDFTELGTGSTDTIPIVSTPITGGNLNTLIGAPIPDGYVYDPFGCIDRIIDFDPFDLLFPRKPTAVASGPYTIGPDEPAFFDHTDSILPVGSEFMAVRWHVAGTYFECEYDIAIPIPYEILTVDLGLENGIYELELELVTFSAFYLSETSVYAITTLEIVPEPCSLLIMGLGGMLLRIKRKTSTIRSTPVNG